MRPGAVMRSGSDLSKARLRFEIIKTIKKLDRNHLWIHFFWNNPACQYCENVFRLGLRRPAEIIRRFVSQRQSEVRLIPLVDQSLTPLIK